MSAPVSLVAGTFILISIAVIADLVSEEIRGRLDRLPHGLVRLAGRRLDHSVGEDVTSEWLAELDAILQGRGAEKLPVTNLFIGIRYAAGLLRAAPMVNRTFTSPIGRPLPLSLTEKVRDRMEAVATALRRGSQHSEEAPFLDVFRNAPTGIAIVDPSGIFLDVNAAFAQLFGQRIDGLRGDMLWRHLHPDDSQRVRSDFDRLVRGIGDDLSGTFRYRTGAGGDGWVDASVSPLAATRSYVVHLVDVTHQKNTEYDLQRQATHDLLTGLPNRRQVMRELSAALRSLRQHPGQVHVLSVDLDGFGKINHQFGDQVGDSVLRMAAERMQAVLGSTITIGRIGGDEFLIVLKSEPQEVPVEEIPHRLMQAMATLVPFEEGVLSLRASIGLASTEDPDLRPGQLVSMADMNMYEVKVATRTHRADEPIHRANQ